MQVTFARRLLLARACSLAIGLLVGSLPSVTRAKDTPLGAVDEMFLNARLDLSLLRKLSVYEPQTAEWRTLRADEIPGQRGKLIVLHLWAEWCGPCKEELPLWKELTHQLQAARKDQLEFVFLSVSHGPLEARQYIVENRARFPRAPLFYDTSSAIGGVLRGLSLSDELPLPTTLLIDDRGVIRYGFIGSVAARTAGLRQAINRILQR